MTATARERLLRRSARAVTGLGDVLENLEDVADERQVCVDAVARGHFRPAEEEVLRAWFARYLTTRAALRETVDDLRPIATRDTGAHEERVRAFLVGYTAACMLIRIGRFLVAEFATDAVVQRKLNEAAPAYRLPRKQFTAVRRSLTNPRHAWGLYDARSWADSHRAELEALADDRSYAPVLAHLARSEQAVRMPVRSYLAARLRYRWHAWRRRRASAMQQALFGLAEATGRVVADVRRPFHTDRVTASVLTELSDLLQPGDVIAARHDHALSNLFLPGYWPHIGLHIGRYEQAQQLGVTCDDDVETRWRDERRVLEARKDGVLLRRLDDTFAVDAFAILRPRIDAAAVAIAVSQALAHEGKLYNFDFDFFTDDRLVCTEVVYRAYEGVAGIEFPLARRAGRATLSAEDILRYGLDAEHFEVAAVYGTPQIGDRLVTGEEAVRALRASMEPAPA